MKKLNNRITLIFILLNIFSFSYTQQSIDYIEKISNNSLINWGKLLYFGEFYTYINIEETQNFIQESLFKSEEFVKSIRAQVLKEIIGININYEITIKDLLDSNTSFIKEFTKRFYSSDIIVFSGQMGDKIKMISNISFLGKYNIIDLILNSRYFFEEIKIKPLKSEYTPYAHNGLVIEARHLDITPSLFPNIYSYDEKGELILIYSINHSDKAEIVKNGYSHFYYKIDNLDIERDKLYYCAALNTNGTKKTDIIISREDYIKFFSSPISISNLIKGNLYIIISQGKK